MKSLNHFISEKLVINKEIKNQKQNYKYSPKSKSALLDNIKSIISLGEHQGTKEDPYDLTIIDVSKVKDMSLLFGFDRRDERKPNGRFGTVTRKSPIYNLIEDKYVDVSNWDVTNVTNFYRMFQHANLKNFIGLETWKPDMKNARTFHMFANLYLCSEKDTPDWVDKNDQDLFSEGKFY